MNFKEILNLFAGYTRQANTEMLRILKTLPAARFTETTGSYYKSVAGILNHGLRSTAGSLKRAADGGFMADRILPVVSAFPQAPMGEAIFSTLDEFADLRMKTDELLVAACAAADLATLERTYSFLGFDKQQKTMTYGGTLLAACNHETHHRGGVSVILDGWGVENDWSGMMRLLFL